ncbi:MAG: N-acetyltransferase, partial [Gorillibacterium sp.]|nr:N-acetyltransferase [Gorillibacterium sp.]
IHPDYHNKGFGFQTMLLAEQLHPEIKKWVLGTPYYSISNQHLYEKAGYQKTGQTEDGFLFLYEKLKA